MLRAAFEDSLHLLQKPCLRYLCGEEYGHWHAPIVRLPAGLGYVRNTTSAVDNCLYAETGVENVFIVTWSLILEGGLSEPRHMLWWSVLGWCFLKVADFAQSFQ